MKAIERRIRKAALSLGDSVHIWDVMGAMNYHWRNENLYDACYKVLFDLVKEGKLTTRREFRSDAYEHGKRVLAELKA